MCFPTSNSQEIKSPKVDNSTPLRFLLRYKTHNHSTSLSIPLLSMVPHEIRHLPWHPLPPKKWTRTRHPRISLQIRHILHNFSLPPQINQFTLHILTIRLGLHQRCQCISDFTFLHFLLDACLVGFADLVVTVHDEGGGSSPELPSFWTSVWQISGKVELQSIGSGDGGLINNVSMEEDYINTKKEILSERWCSCRKIARYRHSINSRAAIKTK